MKILALVLRSLLHAEELERFEFVEPHMGALFRVTLYARDAEAARSASQAAFRRIRELDAILSDYKPDSELMRVCREAGRAPAQVSRDLFRVLEAAQRLAEQTSGAFDVTQAPVIRLWRKARAEHRLPDAVEIQQAQQATGYRKLVLNAERQTAFLEQAGMCLDLGGIAKGYAADEGLRVLRGRGIPQALVAASGDLAIGDAPPGRAGWTIRIQPSGESRVLTLHNSGVSTSGDTEQFLEIEGRRYSHIVNPATGAGLTDRIGVTIVANDGMTADGLATAVSILGRTRGMELIKAYPGASAVIAGPAH